MKKILLGLALALFALPAFAQATYPTVAGSRVNGVVALTCNASGINCAPTSVATPAVSADAVVATTIGQAAASFGYNFNGTTWDRQRSIVSTTAAGTGVIATHTSPTTAAGAGLVATATAAVSAGVVLKASAGNLYEWQVATGAVPGHVLLFDATTIPADGAVTPRQCVHAAASSTVGYLPPLAPERFATGIVIVFSTTGCYTKTSSATAHIRARVQ